MIGLLIEVAWILFGLYWGLRLLTDDRKLSKNITTLVILFMISGCVIASMIERDREDKRLAASWLAYDRCIIAHGQSSDNYSVEVHNKCVRQTIGKKL
jgi:hypothetical protein